MYEHPSQPLIPRHRFIWRVVLHFLAAVAVVAIALSIGVLGYHRFERLPWIDALLNAAMILGGMGPVNSLTTRAGKIFASFYALFAGLVVIFVVGILIAPLMHRFLHYMNLDEDDTLDD